MTATLRLAAALGLALAGTAGTAAAGGLARPISGSPISDGLAGAFVAIADDASAVFANPGGLGFAAPGALASLELVVAPRSYVCEGACPPGLEGVSQDATAIAPAPVVGVLFKPGGAESRLTLGVGAQNSFGGILEWDKLDDSSIAAINAITEVVFEVGVGVGWRVDDRVSLGATVRLGLGLFGVDTTAKPANLDASAIGIGVGASAGMLVRATDRLSLGLAWRSKLDVTTSGSATLSGGGFPAPIDVDVEHVQRWPQSLSLAAAFQASPQLTLALQLDWTQWSRFESLDITFPGREELNPNGHFDLDWIDQFAIRVGGQYALSRTMALRGGLVFDSNAVPDRTIERQNVDANKVGLAAGASIGLSKRMILDLALTVIGGPTRNVADNSAEVPASWASQRNLAPGDHNGQVFTLATGLRISL